MSLSAAKLVAREAGSKLSLLGRTSRRRLSLLVMGSLLQAGFPWFCSSHIAFDSLLPLRGRSYYLTLTLKRGFVLFYTQFVLHDILLLLFLDILFMVPSFNLTVLT